MVLIIQGAIAIKVKQFNSKKTECILDSGEEWTFKTQLKLVGVVVARNLIV